MAQASIISGWVRSMTSCSGSTALAVSKRSRGWSPGGDAGNAWNQLHGEPVPMGQLGYDIYPHGGLDREAEGGGRSRIRFNSASLGSDIPTPRSEIDNS